MGLAQAINGELVFLAAVRLQPAAYLIRQVEGVAQDGKGDPIFPHQSQKLPEIRMQDGGAAGKVEIWQSVVNLAKIQAVIKCILHLLPGHAVRLFIAVFRKDIAVLAPLIAVIGDVPLE